MSSEPVTSNRVALAAPDRLAPQAVQRIALALAAVAAALLLGTAALGPSAAEPALGPRLGWRGLLPAYALGLHPSSGLVTVLLDAGYLVGGLAVAVGLLAARRGARLPVRVLVVAGCVAGLAVLVPPLGSADHVNYAAYGRISAQGGDPYVEAPAHWAGGHDPVTSAVEPPWTTTPSIYGPVATAAQTAASWAGGDSLRATVWCWQLVCLGAWLVVAVLLDRSTRHSPAARSRATWLWLLNPVLLGLLVVGAHVDLLAAAFGLAAIVLAGRRPLPAGVLLGAAVGTKLTFALLGPALLWALWRRSRREGGGWLGPAAFGVLGAALVLVPAHLLAGPHVFDQLARARRFVSLATPWRPLVDALTGPVSNHAVRAGVVALTPVAVALVALAFAYALRGAVVRGAVVQGAASGPPTPAAGAQLDPVTADAALAALVLGGAYLLAAPYSLPWYDAIAWAPLALVAAGALDALLLVRLVTLAVAYVPGRVLGMSEQVRELTLGYRRSVAPWIGLAVLVALVALAWRGVRRGRGSGPRAAPGGGYPGGGG